MGDRLKQEIVIPYAPRKAFMPFHTRTQRWAILVCHRRAGKTVASINDVIRRAIVEGKKDGRYAYIAPYLNQARDIAWDYLLRYAEPIIAEKRAYPEMWVRLVNGARIRLYGADNPDALRGGYFDGVVADEYADWQPRVWREIIRPALADRNGWGVLIGTPKGHNAFHDAWLKAAGDDEWFRLLLRADTSGLLPDSELDSMRKELTSNQYAQELLCDFEAAIEGAYYGEEMRRAEADERITGVPYEERSLVNTAWDLGIADLTAIVWWQQVGREIRVIDYYEGAGQSLAHYASIVASKPYKYDRHYLPHDAEAKELGTGKTRVETLRELGIQSQVVPLQKVEDGINAVKMTLSQCWFDQRKAGDLVEHLKQYRAEYDKRLGVVKANPVHDIHSHGADAFRYAALAMRSQTTKQRFAPLNYPERKWV